MQLCRAYGRVLLRCAGIGTGLTRPAVQGSLKVRRGQRQHRVRALTEANVTEFLPLDELAAGPLEAVRDWQLARGHAWSDDWIPRRPSGGDRDGWEDLGPADRRFLLVTVAMAREIPLRTDGRVADEEAGA
jgi:hypothetical protein